MTAHDRINKKYKTAVSVTADGATKIVFHKTAIVTIDDEKIQLNTGGWWTASTKARMNFASREMNLGYRVFQKRDDWFIEYGDTTAPFSHDHMRIDLRSGDINEVSHKGAL